MKKFSGFLLGSILASQLAWAVGSFFSPGSLVLPRNTTTQRNAIANPRGGLTIFNTTTNRENVYNGSAWGEATTFDALSPMTTAGDLIYGGASGTGTRLPVGSNGQVLTVSAGNPAWTSAGSTPTVSAWASFTMSITGTSSNPTKGTLATDNAQWRRVGDTMEIRYTLIQTGAGSAGSGDYLFLVPNSQSIDSSIQNLSTDPNNSVVGFGRATANSNASHLGLSVNAYDSTHFLLGDIAGGSSIGSGNFGLNNGTIKYNFWASIPISGWTTNN